MSKMADLALQLDEQAVEYGLQGYQEALERGFTYEVAEDGTATLRPPLDEQEMAHKAWLKEKNKVLGDLDLIVLHLDRRDIDKFTIQVRRIIENTIDFIENGEC